MLPFRSIASAGSARRGLGRIFSTLPSTSGLRAYSSCSNSGEATQVKEIDGGERLKEAGCGSQVGHGAGGREDGLRIQCPPEDMPFAVRGLSHVTLAVPDVASAAEHFRTLLGAQVSEILEIPERGIAVSAVHVGSSCLMLMQPLCSDAPTPGNISLVEFLQRQPSGGIHHLSFTVDNLSAAKEHLQSEGVELLQEGSSGRTIHLGVRNNPVLCLHPESVSGVMLELEQVSFGRLSHRIT